MDYEEKYKEALKRARELHLSNDVLQYIFPELKEENDNHCFRPLSSMTEREKIELYKKAGFYYRPNFELEDEWRAFSDAISENELFLPYPIWGDDLGKVYDWLNEHNYDYRGIIK